MTITLDGLTLPDEMIWIDEFEWVSVRSSQKYTLGGRMVKQENSVIGEKGRPITLSGDNAWATRSAILSLKTKAEVPGAVMYLTMHDLRVFQVGFRHYDQPVITADPLWETAYPGGSTLYRLSVKLQVI